MLFGCFVTVYHGQYGDPMRPQFGYILVNAVGDPPSLWLWFLLTRTSGGMGLPVGGFSHLHSWMVWELTCSSEMPSVDADTPQSLNLQHPIFHDWPNYIKLVGRCCWSAFGVFLPLHFAEFVTLVRTFFLQFCSSVNLSFDYNNLTEGNA